MSEEAKRNIIVIGETGSGKSSLVNMVVGRPVAKTSDKAIGCTFDVESYDDEYGNRFFDTVGLNEPKTGTVSAKDAMAGLTRLLKNLEGGINLIIFMIQKGKITETLVKNYAIFVHGICQNKVPTLLAISRCEMDADENAWYQENWEYFVNNDMVFDEVVSGCFAMRLDKVKPCMHAAVQESYAGTQERITTILRSDRYNERHTFGTWIHWLKKVIGSVWNNIARWYGWPQISLYDSLKQVLMKMLGLDATEATTLSNEVMSQAL